GGEDAVVAGQGLVVDDVDPGLAEAQDEAAEVPDEQGGMRLPRRAKVRLHAEVDLHRAALEPGAAALGQLRRLRDLGDTEEPRVERASLVLPSGGHGELDMIDSDNGHAGGYALKLRKRCPGRPQSRMRPPSSTVRT